jgi:hypothetical protein
MVLASAQAFTDDGPIDPFEAPADTFRAEVSYDIRTERLAAIPAALLNDYDSLYDYDSLREHTPATDDAEGPAR